jgi:hypothetical protein
MDDKRRKGEWMTSEEKEQEYINISDLVRLRVAVGVLREIIPENSTVINYSDFKEIMKILKDWESSLGKEIII